MDGWTSDIVVLLVEDDPDSSAVLRQGLTRGTMTPIHVRTGAEALRRAGSVDVVVLDLGLPDVEGAEVCRRLRAQSTVPLLVVSGRGDEATRVELLELGADDFLVKPFGMRELVARIHAVLRRSRSGGFGLLQVDGLRLDRRARLAEVNGRQLALTPREFDLLATLMEHRDETVPRDQLISEVWHHRWQGAGHTLDVHMGTLRRKLGAERWIVTVRGVGFRLQEPKRVAGAP